MVIKFGHKFFYRIAEIEHKKWSSILSQVILIHCIKLTYLNFKFAIGWWIAIDAAAAYPSNDQLLKASHTCGALATVALIM